MRKEKEIKTTPDGKEILYFYNSNNQLIQVSLRGETEAISTIYSYDPNSNQTKVSYPNGVTAEYSYNNRNWLTSLSNKKWTTILSSSSYSYDLVGNKTKVIEADGSSIDYQYDSLYQLICEERKGSNSYKKTYTYDKAIE